MKKRWMGLVLCLVISQVQSASFDCAKASAKVEKLICADAELTELDVFLFFFIVFLLFLVPILEGNDVMWDGVGTAVPRRRRITARHSTTRSNAYNFRQIERMKRAA